VHTLPMAPVDRTMATRFATPIAPFTRAHAVLPMDGVETLPTTVEPAVSLDALDQLPLLTRLPLDLMLGVDLLSEVLLVMPMAPLAGAVQWLDTVGKMLRTAPTVAKVAV